jgi:phosphatidylglycerol---prolipoprotein diacylglyceryl transferase
MPIAGETATLSTMLQYHAFNPIAIEIGPFKVHWYGIMYLVGFGAGWWLARLRAARLGSTWKANDVDDFVFYAMLGVILGGRIGYVLFYGLSYWENDPWYPLKIWEGGMSFHGGLLGVLAAIAVFAVRQGRNIGDVFDFGAPLPGIGLMAGRIGNFINGELWGKATTVPWGFQVDGQVRHASQLYEAFFEGLVLFVLLWWFTSTPRPRFAPSGLFLVIYGTARFGIEFVRVPDEHLGYLLQGWVTMGQILSLPMIIVGVVLLAVAYQRRVPSGNTTVA